MLNRFAIAAFFGLSIWPHDLPAAPKKDDRPALYFPVTVGAKWVYEEEALSGSKSEVIDVVTRVERKGAARRVTVREERDGKVCARNMERFGRRARRLGRRRPSARSPRGAFKLPAKVGDTWEWEDTMDLRLPGPPQFVAVANHCRTVAEEEIEVPAGKFRAVRVEIKAQVLTIPLQVDEWFAPGVGLVKMVNKSGDKVQTITLKSFTPGKK